MRNVLFLKLLICAVCLGCGTSKWTDTKRTATEQLLISDSMDRAVSRLDFRALAGKTVYLDSAPLRGYTDSDYLVSLLRQHMLASGCLLRDSQNEADYIVEARAGAVGTDRNEVLFGVPSVNIPSVIPVTGIPSQIPEIPFIKKTDMRAVTKLAVFAYNRETGRPVWQSGTIPAESTAKDFWVFGAGPFQRGTIYGGTNFAGDQLNIPLIDLESNYEDDKVAVADEAHFIEPEEAELLAAENKQPPGDGPSGQAAGEGGKPGQPASQVVPASHQGPVDNKAAAPAGEQPATEPSGEKPPATEETAPSEPQQTPPEAAAKAEDPSAVPQPPKPLPPTTGDSQASALTDQPGTPQADPFADPASAPLFSSP
jgi:hypothetical protein